MRHNENIRRRSEGRNPLDEYRKVEFRPSERRRRVSECSAIDISPVTG